MLIKMREKDEPKKSSPDIPLFRRRLCQYFGYWYHSAVNLRDLDMLTPPRSALPPPPSVVFPLLPTPSHSLGKRWKEKRGCSVLRGEGEDELGWRGDFGCQWVQSTHQFFPGHAPAPENPRSQCLWARSGNNRELQPEDCQTEALDTKGQEGARATGKRPSEIGSGSWRSGSMWLPAIGSLGWGLE
ncbi:hypothetical protein UY3_08069 [Chelonia mydas]|uniref:Uncharacterized protein n=1 Tax=Chelonia mydas TaxID=8469 RepID=M7C2Y1_CHEMY|nr:hypothetical protein UY3_08069 [Chelonia mydas]